MVPVKDPHFLLTIESPEAQWLELPVGSRRVVVSSPIQHSDIASELMLFLHLKFVVILLNLKIILYIRKIP